MSNDVGGQLGMAVHVGLQLMIITLVDIISIHRLIVVPNQIDVEPQGHTTIDVLGLYLLCR